MIQWFKVSWSFSYSSLNDSAEYSDTLVVSLYRRKASTMNDWLSSKSFSVKLFKSIAILVQRLKDYIFHLS